MASNTQAREGGKCPPLQMRVRARAGNTAGIAGVRVSEGGREGGREIVRSSRALTTAD